jgi:tryptophan synthase alpha chain
VARVADGVVVGSAIVELVAQHGADAPNHVRTYVASLRAAIDATAKDLAA